MNDALCRLLPVLLVLSALAAGCTSTKDLAERNNERCAARGLAPNSDAFADCVTRLESDRDRRMESNRREMMERPPEPPIGGYSRQ